MTYWIPNFIYGVKQDLNVIGFTINIGSHGNPQNGISSCFFVCFWLSKSGLPFKGFLIIIELLNYIDN